MNLDNKKKIIISIILIVILVIAFGAYMVIGYSNFDELNLENEVLAQATQNDVENVEEDTENNNEAEEKIVIHITGEVKKEGLVYLNKGARIADAIEAAGGETEEADLSQVNLAYELQDGQKIYIPNKNEQVSEYITKNSGNNVLMEGSSSSNSTEGSEKVNINTASQSELETLSGIGPSLAQRIIEYREENGDFKSIEELKNVKGIGDAKYENIKDNVTV